MVTKHFVCSLDSCLASCGPIVGHFIQHSKLNPAMLNELETDSSKPRNSFEPIRISSIGNISNQPDEKSMPDSLVAANRIHRELAARSIGRTWAGNGETAHRPIGGTLSLNSNNRVRLSQTNRSNSELQLATKILHRAGTTGTSTTSAVTSSTTGTGGQQAHATSVQLSNAHRHPHYLNIIKNHNVHNLSSFLASSSGVSLTPAAHQSTNVATSSTVINRPLSSDSNKQLLSHHHPALPNYATERQNTFDLQTGNSNNNNNNTTKPPQLVRSHSIAPINPVHQTLSITHSTPTMTTAKANYFHSSDLTHSSTRASELHDNFAMNKLDSSLASMTKSGASTTVTTACSTSSTFEPGTLAQQLYNQIQKRSQHKSTILSEPTSLVGTSSALHPSSPQYALPFAWRPSSTTVRTRCQSPISLPLHQTRSGPAFTSATLPLVVSSATSNTTTRSPHVLQTTHGLPLRLIRSKPINLKSYQTDLNPDGYSTSLLSVDSTLPNHPPVDIRIVRLQRDSRYPAFGIRLADAQNHARSSVLLVHSVEPDSPAAAAGIQVGDQLVAIQEHYLHAYDAVTAAELLRSLFDSQYTSHLSTKQNAPHSKPPTALVVSDECFESAQKTASRANQSGTLTVHIRPREFALRPVTTASDYEWVNLHGQPIAPPPTGTDLMDDKDGVRADPLANDGDSGSSFSTRTVSKSITYLLFLPYVTILTISASLTNNNE